MITVVGSFVVAPAAFVLIWLAGGVGWGMSLLWGVGIFIGLWIFGLVLSFCGDAATKRTVASAVTAFGEHFPEGTPGRAAAVGLLASRIEKNNSDLENAISTNSVPEGDEHMEFLAKHLLCPEPALVAALAERGIISENEAERLKSIAERARRRWNEYCEEQRRTEEERKRTTERAAKAATTPAGDANNQEMLELLSRMVPGAAVVGYTEDAPADLPSFPALDRHARRIAAMVINTDPWESAGLYTHEDEIQQIGREVNSENGFQGMQYVWKKVKELKGPGATSELTRIWNGIGKWQS